MTKDEKKMLEFVMGFIPEDERVKVDLDLKDDWLLIRLYSLVLTVREVAEDITKGGMAKK